MIGHRTNERARERGREREGERETEKEKEGEGESARARKGGKGYRERKSESTPRKFERPTDQRATRTSRQDSPFLRFDSRLMEALTPGRLSFSAGGEGCHGVRQHTRTHVHTHAHARDAVGAEPQSCAAFVVPSEKSENFAGLAETDSHRLLSAPARPRQPHTPYCALSDSSLSGSDCAFPMRAPCVRTADATAPRQVKEESSTPRLRCALRIHRSDSRSPGIRHPGDHAAAPRAGRGKGSERRVARRGA